MASVLSEPIAIIGTGPIGLINAHVLLQDGFSNVTLISKDRSVGGVWNRDKVYAGLRINNVHGEYRFSALEMGPPERSSATGGRLTGLDLCKYLETFSEAFLQDKAHFLLQTEVVDIRRASTSGWQVKVKYLESGTVETLTYARIIVATGGCSNPKIPAELSPKSAADAGFRGLVFHSSQFARRLDDVLASTKPAQPGIPDEGQDTVVVVGGGKSAQDAAAKLANEGRKVTIVFENTDAFLASVKPMADWQRRGRFLGTLMAHSTLTTRWERFLHQTWLGSKVQKFIVSDISESSFKAYDIPADSPLRRSHPLFWSIRVNDEGAVRSDSYFSLVTAGVIKVIAPARVVGYSKDGSGVILSDGSSIRSNVVVLATGYQSSWAGGMFSEDVAEEIGIARHLPLGKVNHTWDYETLKTGPKPHADSDKWVTSIYRGTVPAKSIERRDFVVAGTLFSSNLGYTGEVQAHWIASYLRGDKMKLPKTVDEALAACERQSAWMKTRYPDMLAWVNESYSGSLDFWTWPQAVDELLQDMYLPSQRSGGNWLTWLFRPIEIKEIETLTEERRALRDRI